MTKKFGFALLVAFLIALMPASALLACTVNCAGGSCSGTGSCTCDANDKPKCIDQVIEVEGLRAQGEYARSFNTPGLNSFADSVEKMADALTYGDQDGYFLSLLQREAALKSLSAKERRILNSWDGGNPKAPAQQ